MRVSDARRELRVAAKPPTSTCLAAPASSVLAPKPDTVVECCGNIKVVGKGFRDLKLRISSKVDGQPRLPESRHSLCSSNILGLGTFVRWLENSIPSLLFPSQTGRS